MLESDDLTWSPGWGGASGIVRDARRRRIWARARDAVRALLRAARSGQPAVEVSGQTSARPRLILRAEPVPADPAEHARQFAAVWADQFEAYAQRRMRFKEGSSTWFTGSPSATSIPPPSMRDA